MEQPKTLKACEIMQQLSYVPYINDAFILNICNTYKIKSACWIIHDKDVYTNEDEQKNPMHKSGALKPAHYHIYLQFEQQSHYTFNAIANWFKVEPQYVQKLDARFNIAVLYATHSTKNSLSKYRYQVNEVKTFNLDYQYLLDSYNNEYTQKQEKEFVNQLLDDFVDDKISYAYLVSQLSRAIFSKYDKQIEKAKKYKILSHQLLSPNRELKVIYIYNQWGGAGKTTIAKFIATKILGYSLSDIAVSSASNDPMQDYYDSKVLILDDFRDNVMKYADLLKFLDPYTASSTSARYINRFFMGEYIIITSVQHPFDQYPNIKEDKYQYYRRISAMYYMRDDGSLSLKKDLKCFQYTTENELGILCDKLTWNYETDLKLPYDISFIYDSMEIIPDKQESIVDDLYEKMIQHYNNHVEKPTKNQ